MKNVFIIVLLLSLLIACDDDKPKSEKSKMDCRMSLNKSKVINGDIIEFDINAKNGVVKSKAFAIDGVVVDNASPFEINGLSLGKHRLSGTIEFEDGKSCEKYLFLEVLSDIAPADMTYQVLNNYPHDNMSYTQGLEFNEGIMFEGTGQYGYSFIRSYDLFDQKSIKKLDLSDQYFGEGITVFGNKLYQLTYRKQKAFVYDLESFEKIEEFTYKGMGWGLCHDKSHIIMSNGTNELTFRNPSTFEIERSLYVYDNSAKVDSLNELEYVDGFIYANIYQRNFIVKIDSETGKVVEKIDLTGILNPKDVKSQIDVLNGIAYHPDRKSFYVTGKFWPKLYEVDFISKD